MACCANYSAAGGAVEPDPWSPWGSREDEDLVLALQDTDSRGLGRSPGQRRPATRRAALLAGALALGLGLAVLLLAAGSGKAQLGRSSAAGLRSAANLEESVSGVSTMLTVLKQLAEGLQDAAKMSKVLQRSYKDARKVLKNMTVSALELEKLGKEAAEDLAEPIRLSKELKEKLGELNQTEKEEIKVHILKQLNISSLNDLEPTDYGSTCYDDEEYFEGLCYKKCSLFHGGSHPVRVSAFECCTSRSTCLKGGEIKARVCGGFGVSGDSTGNKCPHVPGGCLKDEELVDDMCYMRCSMLTYGMLPFRYAGVTCCNSSSPFAILELGNCDTDAKYHMGGATEGDEEGPPSAPHPPVRKS